MDKKINELEDLKNFENSEMPTIKFSEVCQLIKQMENTLDIIANEDQYDGFDAALDMVKKFFLGDWNVDTETGDIVTTFMGKETSRTEPPKITFVNGSEITAVKSCGVKNLNNSVVQYVEYLN